jgi:NAD(P)-dependent dehydrogenase (short-subunit alcohol dehydrogenase family)
MKDLAGRTAFVTGAASGIGLGITTALSQAGVKVMLCDIEEEALAKAVSCLKLTNADVDGVRADVSLKAELQAAADATVARMAGSTFWSTMPASAGAEATAGGPMQVGVGFSASI